VNDAYLWEDDYLRLIEGLESDTREPADEERRGLVLDRMIDEELLVQRGLELGLPNVDRRVRADLTQALIASIARDAESREPTEDELAAFYEENTDFFVQPGRLRVRQVFFGVAEQAAAAGALARAQEARRRLAAGEAFERVREELGDAEISPLPDAALPAPKLREYLGPTALRAALELGEGEWSEPVRSGTGYHVLGIVERQPDRAPPFEEIRDLVRGEWLRRAGDAALREYLDELRERAEVAVAPELP
jgi:parvulin-like peptidyl-prolyl isomerase